MAGIEAAVALVPTIKQAATDCKLNGKDPLADSGYGDLPTCIADVKEVVADAEEALADFKKGDPADIMAGIKEIADIITVLKKAETDCKMDKYKEENKHKLGDL